MTLFSTELCRQQNLLQELINFVQFDRSCDTIIAEFEAQG